MADSKITALTSISTSTDPANDPLVIVDVSDTSMAATGTTKKVTLNNLLACSPTATLASATITGDLGVGTASPSTKLEVATATANTRVRINSTSVVATEYFRSGTGLWLVGSDSTNAFKIARGSNFGGSADYFSIGSATADCTWLDGAGGTRMILDSTGLGIGAAPTQKLHVKGVVNFEQVSGGTNGWQVYTYTDGTYRMNYNGAGADELIIDTSGNVGIGVTPSAWAAGYKAIQIAASQSTALMGSGNQTELTTNAFFDGAWKYQGAGTVAASRYSQQSGVHYWYTAAAGAAGIAIGSGFTNAAMTLDASGFLRLAASNASSAGSYWLQVKNTGSSSNAVWLENLSGNDRGIIVFKHDQATGATSGTMTVFQNGGGSTVGSITSTNTATAYNIASDYRLKESVKTLSGGIARISALKPSIYKWKSDGSNGEGFLAHELAEVVPLAVTGEKDAVNEDGSIKPQQVDLSKVVPVLVAAIQELTARVQTLETR